MSPLRHKYQSLFTLWKLLFLSISINAQNSTNAVWNFGNKCRLIFENGNANQQNTPLWNHEGVSSICDENGNLILFTDGRQAWKGDDTPIITNTDFLEGGFSSTQAALIIPFPKHHGKYFIFTTGNEAGLTWYVDTNYIGLGVSLLDLNANNGIGDFEYKNTVLLQQACEKLTSVKACGTDEHWILGHDWNNSNFYAWKLTENGLSQPVISSIGSQIPPIDSDSSGGYAIGYLKASFDGRKVVSINSNNYTIELFDFDINTGILTNPYIETISEFPYGASFSPDNSKLYITAINYSEAPDNTFTNILQYNGLAESEAEFSLSRSTVSTVDKSAGAIELGPDGRLYITHSGKNILSRINSPNETASSCDFVYQAIYFDEPCVCSFGLQNISYIPSPNLPNKLFPIDTIHSCVESIDLNYQASQGSFLWTTGDTLPTITVDTTGLYTLSYQIECNTRKDSIYADFSNIISMKMPNDTLLCNSPSYLIVPEHNLSNANILWSDGQTSLPIIVDSSGLYTLMISNEYCQAIDSIKLEFVNTPHFDLGPDRVICNVENYALTFEANNIDYLWSNGSTNSTITINESGNYWLQINKLTCFASDTTHITLISEESVQFPISNSFSPNNDMVNDEFIIGSPLLIDYSFAIYNRWGNGIFTSNNFSNKWGGKVNDQDAPEGVYFWRCEYNDPCLDNRSVKKGTVYLFR